ncbi:MAG: hypothetical protein AB7O31_07600 [Burkholderiales bacterium]
MDWTNETLRFPTNLDRDAIVRRLVNMRTRAAEEGPAELATLLAGVEDMPSAKVGMVTIAAISMLTEKPEHRALASKLELLAVNLKNLAP